MTDDTKPVLEKRVILEQLERIQMSARFVESQQLSDFLRFIVEETLQGRQEQIKQYTIAVKALGHGTDFDPRSNPIVRVHAHRLRRSLRRYYATAGVTDPIRIDIPVGSYVPTFEPNTGRETQPPQTPITGDRQALIGQPSLAVLVFENLSVDQEQAFFATGLTDELIARLTRYEDLRVIGPLVRSRLKDPNCSLQDVGEAYDARFVLTGSIRRSGDMIRVAAKLTDVQTNSNLWGERFDRNLTASNLFEIEDEITEAVATRIASGLGVIPLTLVFEARSKPTSELVAYEAFLKMRHWALVLTEDAFLQAWQALEHAVQVVPDYALTKATLANIYATDFNYGLGMVENGLERAEELALDAVSLDPGSQEARWVMGFVHFLRRRREQCEQEFEIAYELNPNNAHILAICSLFVAMLGNWECGVEGTKRAMRLNPQRPGWYPFVLSLDHYRKGEYEAALVEALRLKMPGLFWAPLVQAAVFGQLGRLNDAAPYLQQLLKLQPEFLTRGRDLMRRQLYMDENVEMLLAGLYKAGLGRVE